MAAIASVILQLCSRGDHVVASNRLYGGTHSLLAHFLPRVSNITTTFLDLHALDTEAIRSAFTPTTKVLYFESISNPTLHVADIPFLASLGHDMGVTVVVDNTFSPIILSPLRLGADIVIHSVSKYISGGADLIAGAICGPASFINSMMDLHQGALMLLGPTMNPKVAFEISERLPHLPLRIKEHCNRALSYATYLSKLGLKVIYPGLEDHPHHNLLKRMANPGYGYGGMLTLDLGTKERAYKFIHYLQNNVQFGLMAVSLGYYDTLMSCPGSSTSSELSREEQEKTGISPGLVRMSVGYSGTLEQRWSQLREALDRLNLIADQVTGNCNSS
ncbi:hypothetical protein KP509_16G078700 [Ceratopteris richardii]|nr:hypothetical protein KP509_16G078700 [Ceratopteris richardii]